MPPRRTTLSFSSEDAQVQGDERRVSAYYCKFSGKHVLTTDCRLDRAPRRRTDNALVIDTERYTVKMYASDGGVKLIRRADGRVEQQVRYCIPGGNLPVMYKSEPEGRYVYVLDGAVTAFSHAEGGELPPVPPCILPGGADTVQVALEVDDRASRVLLLKITADYVRVQITRGLTDAEAPEELLEFCAGLLKCRLGDLSLTRGDNSRRRLLLIKGTPHTPETVFGAMQAALGEAAGVRLPRKEQKRQQ